MNEMMSEYSDRVKEEGGKFAQAYANAMDVIRKPKPEVWIEYAIAESLHAAVVELRSADNEFYNARQKALKDLNSRDGSKPSENLSSHGLGLGFPFTYGWAAQLDSAASAYDLAKRHFWSVYEIATTWGLV